MELTSEDLFVLAWHVPMTRIAAAVGISDVALKKTYRNRGVPTPPRGHWAKVQAGIPMQRQPAPVWSHSTDSLKLKPKSEDALAALLRDARNAHAATSSSDMLRGSSGIAKETEESNSHEHAAASNATSTIGIEARTDVSSRLELVDFDSFWIHERKRKVLTQVETHSAGLSCLDRLRVEAWLAQARLEIESADPARALISRLLADI